MTKPKQPHPLETLRLRRDWSYMQLAREIERATGVWRDPRQWRRICGRECTPTDRTENAMTAFLGQSSVVAR